MIVVCQKHNKLLHIYLTEFIHFLSIYWVIWFSMFPCWLWLASFFPGGFFFSFFHSTSSRLMWFTGLLVAECNLSCVVQHFFHFLATICHDATYRIVRTRWTHESWILAMIFRIRQCCVCIDLHDVWFKVCRLIARWIILMNGKIKHIFEIG